MVRHDCARTRPRGPSYRIRVAAATPHRPGNAATSSPRPATAAPQPRRQPAAPSGRRRLPDPLSLLTTTCQRPRASTLSALECRTTRSAAGVAWKDFMPRESLTAAPVCCSGWFGTDRARTKPRRPDYRISAPLRDSTPAAGAAPPPSTPTGGQRTRRRRPQRREPGRRRREPRPRPTAPRDGDNDMSAACWTPPRRGLSAEQPAQQPGSRSRQDTLERRNAAPVCCSGWFGHTSAQSTSKPPERRQNAAKSFSTSYWAE